MYVQIRNRLSLYYGGLLMLFLLAFIAIGYALFSYVMYESREEEVIQLADVEYSEHYWDFLQWAENGADEEYQHSHIEVNPQYRSFYYVIFHDQQVIHADEAFPQLRGQILERLANWQPAEGEVRYEQFQWQDVWGEQRQYLLFAGKSIYKDDVYLGAIYSGTDISELRQSLSRLLKILLTTAFVFFLLACYIAYLMAGKAIRPIVQAYAREQRFVADASHELRAPLSVLQASIEVLSEEEKGRLSTFSKQILEDMQEEAGRMQYLVNDLLTLARADAGKQELLLESCDLSAILQKVVRTLTPMAEKKRIALYWAGVSPAMLKADKEKMTQLFYILIDNALKYTAEGGEVEVKLNLQESRKGAGKHIQITVKDTGCGIPPEHVPHLFERFYRLDSARQREKGGSGLGLSIAKWIVDAHGGSIQVQSEVGQGTTFTLSFVGANHSANSHKA